MLIVINKANKLILVPNHLFIDKIIKVINKTAGNLKEKSVVSRLPNRYLTNA